MRSKYLTRNLIILVLLVLFVSIVCIVNNHVKAAYPDVDSATYVIDHLVHQSDNVDFHQEDTIVYRDDRTQADLFPEDYYALLINESDQTVLAAKNVHQRMYPASMTKMMTAIVVADAIEAGTISLNSAITKVGGRGPSFITYPLIVGYAGVSMQLYAPQRVSGTVDTWSVTPERCIILA